LSYKKEYAIIELIFKQKFIKSTMKLHNWLLFFILFSNALPLPAQAKGKQSFKSWKTSFKEKALKAGITEKTFNDSFKGIRPNKKIIKYDRHQPELKQTFSQYFKKRVPPRIKEGQKKLSLHKNVLEEISQKYKVPEEIIVALWGSESNFGRFTGGFSIVEALATLAHDGRREDLFTSELIHALEIIQGNHVKAANMKGSWAGAMGQCQFMPSSFKTFAVDENGNGRKDIWHDIKDVFGSIANYLHQSGWKYEQPWGFEIKYNKNLENLAKAKAKKPLKEWKKEGIKRLNGDNLQDEDWEARIVVPAKSQRAFLLLPNADVLLKWNRSTWFVLSIGLLSDAIQKKY